MMKGALENVEVLHFFFISVLWGDLVLPLITSPPPLLSSPQSAYSHGINDKEGILRMAGGGEGGNGPPQLNVSGSSIAAG